MFRSDMNNINLNTLDFHRTYNRCRIFLIILISMIFTVTLSSTTYRSVISKNFVERQNERGKSSWLRPCVAKFISEYLDNPNRISLLLPDKLRGNISDLVEPLMHVLYTRGTIYILNTRTINKTETYGTSTDTIILVKSAIALRRNNICFTNYFRHEYNFVIVLTNLFTDKKSFLREVNNLIQHICLRSILKLVVLALVGDSVFFAGSLSVQTDDIYAPVESILLAKCEEKPIGIIWEHFINKKGSFLDTCVINATIFERLPYAVLTNDTNHLRFDGIEGIMIEEIAERMKVELNRDVITWTNETNIDKELYLRLYNSTESDLVFGGLFWDFNREMEYTNPYGMVHIAWMVPITTNVSLRGLISPFSANVWYSIIGVFIIGGLIKLFFFRNITFLDIVALLIGMSTTLRDTRTSNRIHYLAWVLFGFFIAQYYLGSLADRLMNATDLQIESMEDLISSGLQVGGTAQFADLFGTSDNEDDNIRRTIYDNFIIFEEQDYIDKVLDIRRGRNTSLALIVMLNLSHIHRSSNFGHAHIMKETIGSYPLAFAVWRGFPYISNINLNIQMFLQVGLIEFLINNAVSNENYYAVEDEEDNSDNLELDDIIPAFLLLIIGYLGGFCLLIIEAIFYPSPILL